MITRTFKLCLNAGTGSAPYINVNQYDEGETWLFELYTEQGERYMPTTGAIVGIKSDGKGIANTGTVDSNGRVVIAETEQMTAAAGLAIFELSIDGLTHGTANFAVQVERKPTDDAIMSDSDYSMFQEAIDAAEVINDVIGDGDPSEVIGEHVDAWLDNHPEATTTVLDGAITAPKINQSLWDKLLVSEEASGAVASFEDGADDVPVSSLKVALEPVQLGSGDPSPTNIRPIVASNGKNLLQVTATSQTISGVTFTVDNGIITANGTATDRITYVVADATFIANAPSSTYFMSGCPSWGTQSTYRMSVVGATGSDIGNGVSIVYTGTISDTRVRIYIEQGFTCNNLVFKPMIRLASITNSSYQPYQGIMVEQTGRNLYPIAIGRDAWVNNASGTHSTDNDILTVNVTTATSSGVYSHSSAQIWTLTPTLTGTYSYSLSAKASANGNYLIGFTGAGRETKAVTTQWQRYTFTGTFDGTEKPFVIYGMSTAGTIEIKDFMLEYGSEAHDYEPYQSASYSYSLGQSVYGGTVDLATGVLTVTHKYVEFNGGWTIASNGVLYVDGSATDGKTGQVVCNQYPYGTVVGGTAAAMQRPKHVCIQALNGLRFLLYDNTYTTAEAFNTYLASNPLQIVYPLATPTTVQLTPQEVKTLLGYNNISSTGIVDVIYHADTKLYVDKITAVDNNIIAPTEEGFTATRNYTVNDLVIVNDTLYKATANIATGSAITPNSNVQQTTLGALIKALS